jgi:hypothetical protein
MQKFDYLVSLSEAALRTIVLSGIESYLVPRPSLGRGRPRSMLEAYGLLWGYETRLPNGATCFTIESATVDTHTEKGRKFVRPSENGLHTMNRIVSAYWPSIQFIGDFHSHPFRPSEEFPALPFLSEQDRDSVEDDNQFGYANLRFRVALLMSIQKMRKAGRKKPTVTRSNVREWRMDNLRMALSAWVALPAKAGNEARLFLVPRPSTRLNQNLRWKQHEWHANYQHLTTKKVWLHAPLHLVQEKFVSMEEIELAQNGSPQLVRVVSRTAGRAAPSGHETRERRRKSQNNSA